MTTPHRNLIRHRQYRAWLHVPPQLATIDEEPPSFCAEHEPLSLFRETTHQHCEMMSSIEPKDEKDKKSTASVEKVQEDLQDISLD